MADEFDEIEDFEDDLDLTLYADAAELLREVTTQLIEVIETGLRINGVFHYEFEFIHPFSDGNGRMGRLWQTLILSQWKPELAYLPVETVIRHQQAEYYAALSAADKASDATGFVEYMLKALLSAMQEVVEAPSQHQVGTKSELTVEQSYVLAIFKGEMTLMALMKEVNRSDRSKFRSQVLNPLMDAGLVEPTIPDKPTSSKQKYRLKRDTH
jgi:hypothetical protein